MPYNAMILVGFGSNQEFLGNTSAEIVNAAARSLARAAGPTRLSRLYRSPAWPDPADPPFVNAVAAVETRLAPHALLAMLQAIEAGFGRRRRARNAPRTLDLDLLAYGRRIVATAELRVPHPRLTTRDFVLAPLRDLAPDWRHPETNRTAAEALADLAAVTAAPLDPA
ncbi:MAG: 2-amino-4-hydroxy-6-hydroxymethyldihydropteridine diphosphokinase [Pseudomonadota bacterium]